MNALNTTATIATTQAVNIPSVSSMIQAGQYIEAEAVIRQQIATAMTAMRSKYAVEAALRQAEITANDAAALAAPAERDEDWRLNAQKEAEAWEAKALAWVMREPECKWSKKAYSRAKVEAAAATEVATERVAVAEVFRAKVEETEEAAAVARAAAEETAALAAGLNVHMQNLSTCLLMQGKTAKAKKVDYDLNALQKKQDELQDWILQFISAPSY